MILYTGYNEVFLGINFIYLSEFKVQSSLFPDNRSKSLGDIYNGIIRFY